MKQVHGPRLAKWDRRAYVMEQYGTDKQRADIRATILAQRRRSFTTVDELGIVRGEVADAIREDRSCQL